MHTFKLTSALGLARSMLVVLKVRAEVDSRGFVRLPLVEITRKMPNAEDVKNVVMVGDPSKPGMHTVRDTFPPGIMSAPHALDQDRLVAAIKGIWHTGTDERRDAATTISMKPGSVMIHPANAVHYVNKP